MIWCGSTEIFLEPAAVHQIHRSPSKRASRTSDLGIAPSQIYAYAALNEGVPFANGAPNLTVDIPGADRALEEKRRAHLRQGLQDRPDLHEDRPRAGLQGPHARRQRMVLHQHPRQSRRRSPRRTAILQDQGRVEARLARIHLPARALPRSLQGHLPQDPHQLLPAARRRKRGLGQHRHLRLARLSHAAQGQLPLPRLHPGRAHRARSRALPRSRQAHARAQVHRHSGVAQLLSQVTADSPRASIPSTISSSSP